MYSGECLFIDDPHKADEAHSDKQRQATVDWYQQTASTRLDSKDAVTIGVQQRLHQGDLPGILLDQGGWEHPNLSVIASTRPIA